MPSRDASLTVHGADRLPVSMPAIRSETAPGKQENVTILGFVQATAQRDRL